MPIDFESLGMRKTLHSVKMFSLTRHRLFHHALESVSSFGALDNLKTYIDRTTLRER